MKKRDSETPYRILFVALVFIYLFYELNQFLLAYIFGAFVILDIVDTAAILAFALLFAGYFGKFRKFLLAAVAVVFICLLLVPPHFISVQDYTILLYSSIQTWLIYFAVFFPPFCIMMLGIYFYRNRSFGKFSGKIGMIFLAASLIFLLVVLYYSRFLTPGGIIVSDEEFIPLQAARTLLSGGNPYSANYSNIVTFYCIKSEIGGAFTVNNNFVGTVNYPTLNFLLYVPFYIVDTYILGGGYSYLLVFYTSAILLMVILALFGNGKATRPNYIVGIFMAVIIASQPSGINILLAAVAMAAYMKLESKYVFILLGIAASMQQIIWVPVLLLITYKANNEGLRSGAKALLGTLLVFLLINGYFIAIGPLAYMKGILVPLADPAPMPFTPFGYALLAFYPIPLGAFTILYIISTVIEVLLMLLINRKEMAWLLPLFGLFLMYRGIPGYGSLFLSLFVITIALGTVGSGRKKNVLLKDRRIRAGIAVAAVALVALAAAYVYLQHSSYAGSHSISLQGGKLVHLENTTVFEGVLKFNFDRPTKLYVLGFYGISFKNRTSFNESSGYEFYSDMLNYTAIGKINLTTYRNSTNYQAFIEPYSITVNGSGERNVTLVINNAHANHFGCSIYGSGTYYICPTLTSSPI